MAELWSDLAILFGWGLLTAISPCPLATNSAAIASIAGWSRRPGRALMIGTAMILGVVAVYVGLALILATSLAASSGVITFLRQVMAVLLGPVLILIGMIVAELLPLPWNKPGRHAVGDRLRGGARSLVGGLGLGLMLGLSFCPTTAAILVGDVIPRAASSGHPLLYPLAYGLGCALPLMLVATLIVSGVHLADRLQQRGNWAERASHVAGWTLIIIGIVVTVHGLR